MKNSDKNSPGFLAGGGEMGELIRNHDWETTSLGSPENWPQSLKTTVGLLLHSAFPMFLFWGKDLLCFYNDAYRPSLGNNGKHPLIGKGGKESWPEIWHFIGPLIEKVTTTGEAVWFEDQFLPIYRNGKMEDVYWTFSYSPAYGDDSTIQGVFVTCTETTSKVIALNDLKETNNKIEKSQEQLLSYFEQSPVAIATISKENLTFRLVNPFYGELVGRKPEEIENKPLLEALPEIKGQGFDDILRGVISTGKPFIAEEVAVELKRKGQLETIYVNLTYQPQRNTKGEIAGILVVATDVTQQVYSRKKVEESGARLKSMVEQTPAPTLVLMGDDLVVEQINSPMLQMIGRTDGVIGNPLILSMPELEGQFVWEQVKKVYKEGISFDQSEVLVSHNRTGVIINYYYNISYRPLKENGKIVGMIQVAIDVTEQVLTRQKVEESEAHLQLTRNAIPAMVFYLDSEQRYRSYNGQFMKWFKVNATEALGKTTREFIGEAAYAKAGPLLARAYQGERVEYHMHAPARIEGERWLNIVYTPHRNASEEVVGVIVHATDITEHMLALRKIEESEARFRNLLQEAPVAATLFRGPDLIIDVANELTLKYWGKSKDIIGKPLAEAAPELEDQQMIALVRSVYEQGGMQSFTEVPIRFVENGVLKDGFYSFSIKALYNTKGEVESVLSTGIEVSEQVNVRLRLEQTQKEIEEAVVQRTKELAESNLQLKRSNEELEQFAYIASHDLQEPIRKISTFTQLLERSFSEISDRSKDYISKIYNSTDRMSKLVRDVLAFSRIRDTSNEFETVDLNAIIEVIKLDFEVTISETHAAIEASNLPTLQAISTQMVQLFGNLMSNSLKYRRQGVKPVIKISSMIAGSEKIAKRIALDPGKDYWHIQFSDNGIGFSEEHIDKIFRIFQRLHGKTEFEGTGIGLAICMKIVHNHGGHISAAVGENGGAVFNILLPAITND